MQTLKEVKIEIFQDIKNRGNYFLGEEERHIVETLTSDINESGKDIIYTEDEVCDIVCQSLDGIDSSDIESTMWEAGYIIGYEVALKEILNDISNSNKYRDVSDIIYDITYSLNN